MQRKIKQKNKTLIISEMKQNKKELMMWIAEEAPRRITQKFIKGDKEHKQDLMNDVDLLSEAIDEAIDLIIYLYALKAKLDKDPDHFIAGTIRAFRSISKPH